MINKYKQDAVDDQGNILKGEKGAPLKDYFVLDEEPIFSSILHNMVLG